MPSLLVRPTSKTLCTLISVTALFCVLETKLSIGRRLEEDHRIRVQLPGEVLSEADLVLLVQEISDSKQCFIRKDNLFRKNTVHSISWFKKLCDKDRRKVADLKAGTRYSASLPSMSVRILNVLRIANAL